MVIRALFTDGLLDFSLRTPWELIVAGRLFWPSLTLFDERNMAKLDADARNQQWHAMTDALKIPLEGDKRWAEMAPVHNTR
jgi:L-rhamnose mutarotase